ncbi:MAG TPA: archaemetzincin family Zn-dependent metalloprotease [Thermoanaerobaculia bacterium]|nr:archaemetzincin family Zn-dependent metalloprotease [Thermoanaerobaculia bacterium]
MKGAIAVWWIGAGRAETPLLDGVRGSLETEYRLPVRLHVAADRPVDAYDVRRGQHASAKILSWLSGRAPAGSRRILGVTDADLFIPILTFVFGEAELHGHAAVVSTARLAGLEGTMADPELLAIRLAKECVHEVGHTFGLIHCRAPGCAMARSASLRDVDAKTGHLCAECRERFDDVLTKEARRHEPQEHPHPDRR